MKTYTYSYQNGLCRGREAGRGRLRTPANLAGYLASFPASAEVVRDGPCRSWGRAFLRSDRNKCTSSSCFCLRILVRLRGQRSIRKTCVSIRNITYFIFSVSTTGMFILQVRYPLFIRRLSNPMDRLKLHAIYTLLQSTFRETRQIFRKGIRKRA